MRSEFVTTSINGFPAIQLPDGRLLQIPGGGVPEGDEPGTGGDGSAADAAHEPGTEGAEGTADTTRAADDKGEREPANVPYHRFKERNETARRYEKLGKPEEIEQRLARAEALERREQEAADAEREQQDAERRKANPKMADAEDLILDVIRRKAPGVLEDQANRDRDRAMQIERHVQHGMEQIPALLKEHGIPVTDESVEAYETLVESQILKDPTLKAGFWKPATQAGVMKEAFTRAKAKVINPALQAAGAKTLDDARARAARTIGRPAQSGTARVEPKKFTTTHKPGTSGYEADRDRFRRQAINDLLDADTGEEAAGL